MDSDDLEALAAPMLDDIAAVLAAYDVDIRDPQALAAALGSLAGVVVGRAETQRVVRRGDVHTALARGFAAGRDAAPACPPGCVCQKAA